MSDWTAIGAPLDSAGAGEGEQRAPAALRRAGLLAALGAADSGDLASTISDSSRDPETGVIGYAGVLAASLELREAVSTVLESDARPLVLGGDCTLLIGALAGARAGGGGAPVGLAFIDGHLDFYDGWTSPTGECADMDLAIVTGGGPAELDADVLDPEVMPAVSYPEPGGLGLGATLDLLRPLGRSGALIGVSVADLNSDLDPDDECARSLSGLLAAALNQP